MKIGASASKINVESPELIEDNFERTGRIEHHYQNDIKNQVDEIEYEIEEGENEFAQTKNVKDYVVDH